MATMAPTTRSRRRTRVRRATDLVAVLVAVLLGTGVVATPAVVDAAPRWAPAASASIHPGVPVRTQVGMCTANFVFYDDTDVYLGMAAHCGSLGSVNNLNGCAVRVLPLGAPVRIQGATRLGTIAYSSWAAMQAAGESDRPTCLGNDFALIRIDPADHRRVNPTVPHWGGPTGVRPDPLPPFASIYSYGQSPFRGETELLHPMLGISVGTALGGWRHDAYHVLPGVPGDSGGPTMDRAGRAAGVISSLNLFPKPGGNGLTAMGPALHYARTHGLPGLRLALGTEPFDPDQLPLG